MDNIIDESRDYAAQRAPGPGLASSTEHVRHGSTAPRLRTTAAASATDRDNATNY